MIAGYEQKRSSSVQRSKVERNTQNDKLQTNGPLTSRFRYLILPETYTVLLNYTYHRYLLQTKRKMCIFRFAIALHQFHCMQIFKSST